ncbi:SDR family NAD(P)-dependent oxidoreductase [Rhodococcus qingshengii]|uniref:SDR family NAD(P)-dependent oxidoreductase n=1 Tax=Rhodococcus qingshengii TaxID=334542 RepID=UPI001F14621A|nr:SDR family oxidoreductase [Rhodococcus qingshengii]ULD45121.1 SDR family oxidoreductase [Rhodococcus qingshengii]
MSPVQPRLAVVTGAGSGIGAATALILAERGEADAVMAVDVDADGLSALRDRIGSTVPCISVTADISSVDGVERVTDAVRREFGWASMLHNNAGIIGQVGPLLATEAESFDAIMRVNARGCFLVLQSLARLAVASSEPMSIVNTSSASALKAAPGLAAYAMSKAAIVGLTRTAAHELAAHRIRVNAIAPGRTDTPLVGPLESTVASREDAVSDRPISRAATPKEVAELAVWLLSERASFVTGSIYPIDGGLTA